MVTEEQQSGIVFDSNLVLRTVRYYSIIGAGLGLLGTVLLMQLGSGAGREIVSGLLSIVVLAFAILSGPIIAAFIGYATAEDDIQNIRERSINSGIANGIGFAVFGIIVAVFLLIGMSLVLDGGGGGASAGSGSPMSLPNLTTLIIMMIIPNGLVGGAITFFLEG